MNRLPVLLTRPARANAEFAAALRARLADVEILESPLQEIVLVEPENWPGKDDALVFTSRNGVEALAARQAGDGRRAYCVGARTARAAEAVGFKALAGAGEMASLPELIAADPPTGALWYLHGAHRRGDLAAALAARGISCRSEVVYDQQAQPLTEAVRRRIEAGEAMLAPLFSPRSAALLAAATKNMGANLLAVALSRAVANEWPGAAEIVARPEADKMLEAVLGRVG